MNGCVYRTADGKCKFYSDHGKGIVSWCDFDDCEEKKPSNADRIRAMSDEELAHLLHSAEEHLFTGNLWNYEKWTEWLKQEVKDERTD